MERKRDGFVPIGDVAGAVQLSSGRGLTPVAPDAPRHFTKLDQVDQFVRASAAEADVGFMARLLALCRLRRTDLSDRRECRRVNGPFRLYMQAGPETKLPYGNLPRLGAVTLYAGHPPGRGERRKPPRPPDVLRAQRGAVVQAPQREGPGEGRGAEVTGGQGRGLTGEDPQGVGADAVRCPD